MSPSPRSRRRGVVASFDESSGYGSVSAGEGVWFFHCTAIADGSRIVDVGTTVDFSLRAGHLGRWEAAELRPAGS